MKESNSFEEALKRVLIPEKAPQKPLPKATRKRRKSNYVSEAIGSSQSMPSIVSRSSDGGSNGMPPFSRYSSDMEGGQIDMRDIGKEENDKAKSVKAKPYPLETAIDHVSASGDNLQKAESLVYQTIKNNPTLSKKNIEILKQVHQTIKSSLGNISKAAKVIDSITLS